jgi:YD repeat-containing protein
VCDQGNYRVGWRRAQICDLPHSGFANDAAGNLTGDGTYTYQWDAEGRLKSVNNGAARSHIYNAGGAYVPAILVGMYATQGRYNLRVSMLKHYYGLNHLHYLATRMHRRARRFDSERSAG